MRHVLASAAGRNGFRLALGLLLFGVAAGAHAESAQLPTWPQQFRLAPGEAAGYAFPVTQPGDVKIGVQWQGRPLQVTILGPTGAPVAAPALHSPPSAAIAWKATPDQVRAGAVWVVRLAVPAASGQPSSLPPDTTGSLAVAAPPVDPARVAQALASLANQAGQRRQSQLAQRAAVRQRPPARASVDGRVAAFEKARRDRSDALAAGLRARFEATAQQQRALLARLAQAQRQAGAPAKAPPSPQPSASPSALKPTGTAIARGNARPPGVAGALAGGKDRLTRIPPTLYAVTPGRACAGETVTLSVAGIAPDAPDNQVWFTVNPGRQLQGTILSYADSARGFDLVVKVPDNPGLLSGFRGDVTLKAAGVTTPPVAFVYEPYRTPLVSAVDPSPAVPGGVLVISGQGFKPDDSCWVGTPAYGGACKAVSSSPTVLVATLPDLPSVRAPTTAILRISSYEGTTGKSVPCCDRAIALLPGIPYVANVDRAGGEPGEPVLLTGSGFKPDAQVHFVTGSGRDQVGRIERVNETQIMAYIPDYEGLAAPFNGQIYVRCSTGTSDGRPFTFRPQMVTQLLDLKQFPYSTDQWGLLVPGDSLIGTSGRAWILTAPGTDRLEIGGEHHADGFTGHRGDDLLYQTSQLKNGWVVESILDEIRGDKSRAHRIEGSGIGTPSLYVKVHWWADVFNGAEYDLSWYIRGPKGVPYR